MGLTCSRCTCCCPQPTYTTSTAATTATSGQPPSSQVLKKRTSSTSRDVSASSDTAINVMTRPSSTSRLGLCLRPKRFRGSRGRLRRSRSLDSGPDIPLHEIDAMEKRQKLRRRSQAPTIRSEKSTTSPAKESSEAITATAVVEATVEAAEVESSAVVPKA